MTSYGVTRLNADPKSNFVDDMTTTAALTLMVGIFPFVLGTSGLVGLTVNLIGVTEDDDVDWDGADGVFPPIVLLLANIIQTLFGLVSIIIGFQYVACKWGSTWSSLFGLGITLAAWFPFLVQIALIGFNADNNNIGGPPLLIPSEEFSQQEINAIALMGILGFYGYAGTVVGALTFLHWKMYRCFAGFADTYDASYYRSRLTYYGGLIVMTGAVQLALGAYVQDKFGDGQLSAPVITGVFFILWPELSITVGLCQLIVGLLTLYRSTTPGVGPATGNRDSMLFPYQIISFIVLLVSIGCQIFGQISLHITNAPAIFVVNIVGFCLFPIYLDAMAHTTPENLTKDMFSMAKI